jgi:HSP20 family protein
MFPMISRRGYRPLTFQDFFNEDFVPSFNRTTSNLPAVNIKEDEKAYFLELAIPGMNKNDVKIELKDEMLTISSEHKEEKEEKTEGYNRKEFSYNSFCRSFYLPEGVDTEKINASYKDGVLGIEIPKKDEEKKIKSREVTIS